MSLTLSAAISTFGKSAKAKLSNPAARGEPEDQLRAPLEYLLLDLAELCGFPRSEVSAVGESTVPEFKTRPDYAVTSRKLLVGHIEVKAPGKGADPRKFRDKHDKEQWKKLQSLPNLLYTDGNEFCLFRNGEIIGSLIRLDGDVETSGAQLHAPPKLQSLFEDFLRWQPIPPRDARSLAEMTARLCRVLRDEVTEQLAVESPALTALAADWRMVLFPDASDAEFADGYAQAVTFGMLMARAREIKLCNGLDQVARQLRNTDSLIGSALRLLTDNVDNQETLKTSLSTLIRVLDVVDWKSISKGDPDAWLYFYEDFLEVYDSDLRKQTGSYYSPPQVVGSMVRLVDDVLRSRFNLPAGLASPSVKLADPAVGTGTFILGILRCIAGKIEASEGKGAVPGAINAAMGRLIAFELQLGPFAVAQLRILAELAELTGSAPTAPLRMFVTDTLSSPYVEDEWLPSILGPIAESRKQANAIKRREPITVVIGNPPYKEKAKGRGGWVESGSANSPESAPLDAWKPPREWGVGAHTKHLRNLYVYFWRWATWKVFDHDPAANTGVICFITVAGFLNGPGFEKMRDDLRRKADDIWVIDCSPEGHQPDVPTRIFQGVQQPVCIVLVSRSADAKSGVPVPARVRFHSLPSGPREAKFAALETLTLESKAWTDCPTDWRAPFLPKSAGAWGTYPVLEDLFVYNGSGVMPGRTWVIAPDAESLQRRWQTLISAASGLKEALFHPHLRNRLPGDKHSRRIVTKGLPGHDPRPTIIADERGPCNPPIRYGFRTLDRQWVIPDNRLINQPNPTLWEIHSDHQVFLTALSRTSPSSGPAVSFTALIPDLDHYRGSFGGRVFPLWRDQDARRHNMTPSFLTSLGKKYRRQVSAEDLMAYLAAVLAHPAFTARFKAELIQPGLRVPFTAKAATFAAAVEIGRSVIWLHTFGERFADPAQDRPSSPPRLPKEQAPRIPKGGMIPASPDAMPDTIDYDEAKERLLVGQGYVEHVTPGMWAYEVSGKHVLRQWFSYRKANRERPIMGDRRPPSKLGEIQPDHWLAEYTTELINVLHVIGRLIELEPTQAALLERICSGPTIPADEFHSGDAIETPKASTRRRKATESQDGPRLFE